MVWSSATSTRMRRFIRATPSVKGTTTRSRVPLPGASSICELPAEQLDAVAHAAQPEPVAACRGQQRLGRSKPRPPSETSQLDALRKTPRP